MLMSDKKFESNIVKAYEEFLEKEGLLHSQFGYFTANTDIDFVTASKSSLQQPVTSNSFKFNVGDKAILVAGPGTSFNQLVVIESRAFDPHLGDNTYFVRECRDLGNYCYAFTVVESELALAPTLIPNPSVSATSHYAMGPKFKVGDEAIYTFKIGSSTSVSRVKIKSVSPTPTGYTYSVYDPNTVNGPTFFAPESALSYPTVKPTGLDAWLPDDWSPDIKLGYEAPHSCEWKLYDSGWSKYEYCDGCKKKRDCA